MKFRISFAFLCVFCVLLFALALFAAINYPGRKIIYITFTIALNALLILGFTKGRIYFDTFIGIFFWLGYWLKLSVRVAFAGGRFHESVGNFNGTGAAFDHALIVTTCGIAALLIARFIRRKFFFSYMNTDRSPGNDPTFAFYQKHRPIILTVFLVLIIAVAVSNVFLGIYQRGAVPGTILPWGLNGVYTWLLLFGFAAVSAMMLDFEFRMKKDPYLASFICLMECFFSNSSMLSRGMILNGGALLIGAQDNLKKRNIDSSLIYKFTIASFFVVLFVSSTFAVTYIRNYTYIGDYLTKHIELSLPACNLPAGNADNFEMLGIDDKKHQFMALKSTVKGGLALFIDRWVGIEGIMAVSSYPHLGWGLWKRAWKERFSNYGTSMYDLTFIRSPYLESDMLKHHFVSIPGILAFFYYPGSFPFLFFSMFSLGLLAAGIEFFVYRFSGANLILCSLLAQVVAYRYAHFGYAPSHSYLLFGSVFLTVIIIYTVNRSLTYLHGKQG